MPFLSYIVVDVVEYNTIMFVFIDCKSGTSDLSFHCRMWYKQLQKKD